MEAASHRRQREFMPCELKELTLIRRSRLPEPVLKIQEDAVVAKALDKDHPQTANSFSVLTAGQNVHERQFVYTRRL